MVQTFSGRGVLRSVESSYERYRESIADSGKRVSIIRFDAHIKDSERTQVQAKASRISAKQKIRAFEFLGFEAPETFLDRRTTGGRFADLLSRLNEDPSVTGIIVQYPPPPRLDPVVQSIAPDKDLDALLDDRSPYRACATADGIVRIADPYVRDKPPIAVVGGKGFVGTGVVRLLRDRGIDPLVLDAGDDLRAVHDAEVVISTTGTAGVLGREHLRPHHRLVVDSGFVPQLDGSGVLGDVRRDAYDIPQAITPVPGGTGPVEMAVLMERVVRKEANPDLVSWTAPEPRRPERETAALTPRQPRSPVPVPTAPTEKSGRLAPDAELPEPAKPSTMLSAKPSPQEAAPADSSPEPVGRDQRFTETLRQVMRERHRRQRTAVHDGHDRSPAVERPPERNGPDAGP